MGAGGGGRERRTQGRRELGPPSALGVLCIIHFERPAVLRKRYGYGASAAWSPGSGAVDQPGHDAFPSSFMFPLVSLLNSESSHRHTCCESLCHTRS